MAIDQPTVAYYRVVAVRRRSGSQEKELVLERIEKPTTPNPVST